ncbi:response regulator transcription factor [Shewanella sp.]|uniref:response regulator transcription factor n=1 Tax=Shewanella sp. TaxID=50422 RepID=UPI0040543A42
MRVLVIEDDIQVADYLSQGLMQSGHSVESCYDGKMGLIEASTEPFDVIILDRMLPKLDGIAVVKSLRSMGVSTPVLMLSNLSEVDHKVEGLTQGCDDYLAKPFAFVELLARLEILAKRGTKAEYAHLLTVADLTLDLHSRQATRAGQAIDLLSREFKLLEYLMRNMGKVVTKTMLLEQIWSLHFDPQTNVVEVQISRLRKKIDGPNQQPLIHTIRGAGYLLSERP